MVGFKFLIPRLVRICVPYIKLLHSNLIEAVSPNCGGAKIQCISLHYKGANLKENIFTVQRDKHENDNID